MAALIDTSAWLEYMRGGREDVRASVRELIREKQSVVTEPVWMELLAGVRDHTDVRTISRLLKLGPQVIVEGLADWEVAATIYRTCRRAGFTPRSQIDCLIAAVAIREGIPVLHADRDFDEIAKHTQLEIAQV